MGDGSPTLKTCTKCGSSKPTDEFYQTKGRLLSECKVCWRARVKARNEAHPHPPKPRDARGLAWTKPPPEVVKARKKATRERNQKIVLDLKTKTPCADCGRVLPPVGDAV